MNSCFQFLINSLLRPKTIHNVSSAPTVTRIPKKDIQVQDHRAGRFNTIDSNYCGSMNAIFQKADISKNMFKSVDIHAKRSSSISCQCSATATTNDREESENYHVFLSFNGKIRTSFTCHLNKGLTEADYRTFIDYLMRRGVNIPEELVRAIRNSLVAVIVISPGYASSQSCLDELTEILLRRRRFGLKVLPIFYRVDPDDVYDLRGAFGAAFDSLFESLGDATDERVNHWKEAFKEVARITGLVLHQHENETDFIEQIVMEVEKLIGKAPQRVPSFMAGWHSFIHGFKSYIMIGIVGGSMCLFVFTLMVNRLGIVVSLDLHSVKQAEKLKKDYNLPQ